ncbi:transcription-repair coupling factor, partial [bacterium]|nr:transcription-repair coupling factor [bacterium]
MNINCGFEKLDKYTKSINALKNRKGVVYAGICNIAKSFLVCSLKNELDYSVLIITAGTKEEELLREDFEIVSKDKTFIYHAWDNLPNENIPPHKDISAERFRLLNRLISSEEKSIVISSYSAILQKAVDPDIFQSCSIVLNVNDNHDFTNLIRSIFHLGYKRVDRVEQIGEYSVRGGIIDIFSLSSNLPYRIEFWANTIDTIRMFDPTTQLSEKNVNSLLIFPADEFSFFKNNKTVPFFDYLSEKFIVIIDEPHLLRKKLKQITLLSSSMNNFFIGDNDFYGYIKKNPHAALSYELHNAEPFFKSDYQAVFGITPPKFLDQIEKQSPVSIDERLSDLKSLIADGYNLVFNFNNIGEKQRFFEICADKKFESFELCPHIFGSISGGFVFPETRFALISDKEIFGRYRSRPATRRRARKKSVPLREIAKLNVGDLAVHVNYGIAVYQGIQKIRQTGENKEMIVLEYANKSKLFVPLLQSNLVQRYIGCGHDKAPKLDVLGSTSWIKKKRNVEEAVFDLAAEYIDIQAARKTLSGFNFEKDNSWQREFEASFIYNETDDQNKAIESIKSDMESNRPMDRLVCGDVGYGKTEVAVRAAFKAVMSNKQVAVLVPTTVLAQQHLNVFSERMANYPVRIEMLSRFRTQSEQKKIINEAKEGSIDILIGTHRLLQPDVKFKDIGLIIIDEEQRFGVRHKESFKHLRRLIDVLTLTATPIPRTLYLALVGARDMSTINTPPEDRLPVETYVSYFDDDFIRNTVLRELNREGQVFFVHNRVKTIYKMKNKLKKLLPNTEIAVAHGQMPQKELSHVMESFSSGETDILLCTTIIESGLDIPNANTIIIDRADRFGLADLYQLRGRVGRYKNRAYAYLLVPPYKVPTEQAQHRLDAIEMNQQLGAGFQIAMRDLEIRGAGNILGDKQHGHIASVGFDLYCNLLKKAIAAHKGESLPESPKVILKLGFEPEIPPDYIPSDSQRMAIYSRLQDIVHIDQVEELKKELDDIYGDLPENVALLLDCVTIKLFAGEKNINYIEINGNRIILK